MLVFWRILCTYLINDPIYLALAFFSSEILHRLAYSALCNMIGRVKKNPSQQRNSQSEFFLV